MIQFTLVKGPLDRATLQEISQLYGTYDPKYCSLDFCHGKFNDNLLGYSLHALAWDKEMLVGHYALIPLPINFDGKEILGAKGEAFVVHQDCRKEMVELNGKKVKLGFALPKGLYPFALKQGVEVMVMIAPKDVGVIHCIAGSKALPLKQKSFIYFLDKPASKNPIKRLVRSALALVHHYYSRLLFRCIAGKCLPERDAIDWDMGDVPPGKWSISRSASVLQWYQKMGLQQLTVGKDKIVYYFTQTAKDALEIVGWHQEIPSVWGLVRLLLLAIEEARRYGIKTVIYTPWQSNSVQAALFRKASLILGFVPFMRELCFYVQAKEPLFYEQSRLEFGPFFYVTF